ncbi:MAG: GNAT family N-acetyltransferase [Mycobacteriales bacterium]|nr:GNAT family N-acetyltransferase [Mycobacteriales bacterium]
MIRPMTADDVEGARLVTVAALQDLDRRIGEPVAEVTEHAVANARRRIGHLQATDPDSSWVAVDDDRVVACALALVRDGTWFLSLLMVEPSQQGTGLGRQLLDRSLTTATDRSWITSTVDPAALRRYRRAGFDLVPAYVGRGPVDRALLPATPGVRVGSFDDDRDLVEDVLVAQRGARSGTDLDVLQGNGWQLLVVDDAAGRGFAVVRHGGPVWVGGTTTDAARQVLIASVAEAGDEVEVDWLSADQQWAIDACLDLRLGLHGGASICLRGRPGPMTAYLPSGAFG